MRVTDAMRRNFVTVDESASVTEASMNMSTRREGCAIILRQGKPFGIMTEQDVTWKVAAKGLDPKNVKVAEVMSSPLITVDPDVDLMDAAKLMAKNKIRRLVAVRGGSVQGILRASDISRHLETYMDQEMRAILRYTWMPRFSSGV